VIGRVLCWIGVHRWGFGTMVDHEQWRVKVTTYQWCLRAECPRYADASKVDVEYRWKPYG
jgi:hypothetical protein